MQTPTSPSPPTSPSNNTNKKPCRCRIYLEPCPNSNFYQSIEEFYARTYKIYGANEAHQSHPHISVTGFFTIIDDPGACMTPPSPDSAQESSSDKEARPALTATQKLDLLTREIDSFLQQVPEIQPPKVEGILLVPPDLSNIPTSPMSPMSPMSPTYHYSSSAPSTPTTAPVQNPLITQLKRPHHHRRSSSNSTSSLPSSSGIQSLLIPLDAPPQIHELSKKLAQFAQDLNIQIRRKSINHISLAYAGEKWLDTEGVRERLSGEVMQSMAKLAGEMIRLEEVKGKDASGIGWDLVIWEMCKNVSGLEDRYGLREIKRWRVIEGANNDMSVDNGDDS